ncbi:MAG: hypothetical protein V3S32_10055 [Acidimicrobiia bacterium]
MTYPPSQESTDFATKADLDAFKTAVTGRLEAELFSETDLQCAERPQRFCVSARAVERHHQMSGQLLAQRVLANQGLQLTDQFAGPSDSEIGAYSVFNRGKPKLLETSDLGLSKRLVGELLESVPSLKG